MENCWRRKNFPFGGYLEHSFQEIFGMLRRIFGIVLVEYIWYFPCGVIGTFLMKYIWYFPYGVIGISLWSIFGIHIFLVKYVWYVWYSYFPCGVCMVSIFEPINRHLEAAIPYGC